MPEAVVVSIIAGSAIVVAAAIGLLGLLLGAKVNAVHLLVNSRLDAALEKIERLEKALGRKDEGSPT
jgi:hypothetical protein